MIALTFDITLKSNYHIGAGYGKGFGLDSALLREVNGTPVMRGSTLAGLLRGGAYQLLELPLLREQHERDCALERLFGSPRKPRRWYFTSAHPVSRLQIDSQVVQRVRVDPRTRRAESQKLFSQEEGRAEQVFRFQVTCPADDASVLDEAAFLVAAARYVRQLGRSRRRGLGECVIHLTEVAGMSVPESAEPLEEDWFINHFNHAWLQGELLPSNPSKKHTPAKITTLSNSITIGKQAVRVRIIVRLDEPLLISERAPAGNQFDTLSYIPGNTVLGVLAGQAAHKCDLSGSDSYRDFVTLFRRGDVIFPMLYLAYEYSNNLYPTIPSSLGLVTCSVVPFEGKSKGHDAYRSGIHPLCPKCHEKGHKNRLEPVEGFSVLGGPDVYTISPQRASELHIQINEKTQRVEEGQLYGYTVLSAGQYFIGELLCANEDAWERLKVMTGIAEKKPLVWRMGKARRRGYGQVTAWLEKCDADCNQTWIQVPLNKRVSDLSGYVSMTLLTDTIITDAWGRQANGFTEEWLESTLQLGKLTIDDAYARSRAVDSFNAYLGLPRWRDTALIAGSVVWFHLQSPSSDCLKRLQELEVTGIGSRRNEGFGRVAFNHPVYKLCEGVEDSAVGLDREMQLDYFHTEDSFMKYWEEYLKDRLSTQLDSRFTVLARWLYTQKYIRPEELCNQLNTITIGQPDLDLLETIDEYGDRSKDNFFLKDGKKTVDAICEILAYLQSEEQRDWSRGIVRLSEWLTVLIKEERR